MNDTEDENQLNFKSGFVGIIGRPNVGKSTLMNTLLKQKITITSSKPQTTRNRIMGILTEKDFQCVFIDTPGIMTNTNNKLDEYMVNVSFSVPKDVDAILYMVDNKEIILDANKMILNKLNNCKKPVILVINKIDKIEKDKINKLEEEYKKIYNFAQIVNISALNNINIDKLIFIIVDMLPFGPKYFSSDLVTEHPERFIIAEFIREKVIEMTKQEVPYAIAVKVEDVKERKADLFYVRAILYCERDSQRGIIIGNQAKMLKQIGINARKDIEELLGTHVFLDLQVKVKKNWRKNPSMINYFGYK